MDEVFPELDEGVEVSIEGRSSVCCFLGCASVISGETSTTQSVQTEPELEVWLGSSVRCCGGCPSGIAEDTAEWATSSLPVAKMTGETIGETTNGGVSMSGETVVGTSDVGVSVSGGDVGLFCRDRSFFVPVLDCPLPSESVHSESVMEGKSGGLDGGVVLMPSWVITVSTDGLPLVPGEVTTSAKVFGLEGESVDIPSL